MKPIEKRTQGELRRMPLPRNPAELEVLSMWYFGKPLHLKLLSGWGDSFSYEVAEDYNSYHGEGWLFDQCCIDGYDYSRVFWRRVIGELDCGGIARASHGSVRSTSKRSAARLRKFSEYLRRNESGRLGTSFRRLAHEYGMGENAVTRDSCVQTGGRVDGAPAASNGANLEVPHVS